MELQHLRCNLKMALGERLIFEDQQQDLCLSLLRFYLGLQVTINLTKF